MWTFRQRLLPANYAGKNRRESENLEPTRLSHGIFSFRDVAKLGVEAEGASWSKVWSSPAVLSIGDSGQLHSRIKTSQSCCKKVHSEPLSGSGEYWKTASCAHRGR